MINVEFACERAGFIVIGAESSYATCCDVCDMKETIPRQRHLIAKLRRLFKVFLLFAASPALRAVWTIDCDLGVIA